MHSHEKPGRNEDPKHTKANKKKLAHEAEAAAAGAVAGAAVGAVAGPPGMIAGAVIGGAAGAMTGAALDDQAAVDSERDAELDGEIGVDGRISDMGAPNLKHPPARFGAYSGAAAGMGGGTSNDEADGPIPPPSK